MNKIRVVGKRLLVQKEKIDCGGLKLTPSLEEDGQKNKGVIIGVGQIGLRARLRGIRKGAVISFHKHFTANNDSENPLVFVELSEVLAVHF